ncbi:TPA: flippase-like domain-containing protein [Candidatus Poribacteria bacterium]|nr:flippase-like domain-containing protein [Candidatus Poribacteria bacterium]
MRIGNRTYNVRLGLTIFLAISIVSAIVILFLDVNKSTWSALRQIKPEYSLIVGLLMLTQWLINALRFQILVNSFEEKISFWTSFQAFMANIFMSAMTPSQTGGGPLQVYIINRAGIPLANAIAGCLIGAVLTIVCLVFSSAGILLFRHDIRLSFGHHMGAVITVVFIVFFFLTLLFMLSIFKIRLIKYIFGKIALRFSHYTKSKRKFSLTKKLIHGLDQYNRCMKIFAKAKKYRILLSGLLTMCCICANCAIAPVLLKGLSIKQDALQVFLTQFIIFFIVYFSPTPGASGLAEFSNYWIMASVNVEQNLLGIYTLIWRFFTSFIGVGVGGLIVLTLLKKRKKYKSGVKQISKT